MLNCRPSTAQTLLELPTTKKTCISTLSSKVMSTTPRNRKLPYIRRQNLEALISEAGSAVTLARLTGTNSSYLSQIRNQTPTQNGTPRQVGINLAEKLEKGMNKPMGWMDEPHTFHAINHRKQTAYEDFQLRFLPLFSWENLAPSRQEHGHPDADRLPCPCPCSEQSFVLSMDSCSMEPALYEGEILFVDPAVDAEPGNFVIFFDPSDKRFKCRQLIQDSGHLYLMALNHDWPNRIFELNKATTIHGVVIFKGRYLISM